MQHSKKLDAGAGEVVACRADMLFLLCLLFESARSPVPAHCPHSHALGAVVFMALCTRCLCGSFG